MRRVKFASEILFPKERSRAKSEEICELHELQILALHVLERRRSFRLHAILAESAKAARFMKHCCISVIRSGVAPEDTSRVEPLSRLPSSASIICC